MRALRVQSLRIPNLRQAAGKVNPTIALTCALILAVSVLTLSQLYRTECASTRRQLSSTDTSFFQAGFEPLIMGEIAVCVCGSPAFADLTALRLVSDLPAWLTTTKVRFFLSTGGGKHVHKLAAFKDAGARIAAASVQAPEIRHNVSQAAREVFESHMSAKEMEALLHSWSLVDSCYDLVERDEAKRGRAYKWVMNVGMDQFWSGDLPLSPALSPTWSYLPLPAFFKGGGYSHDAGLWTRDAAPAGMKRITMLLELQKMGVRKASPGRVLKHWLDRQNPPIEVGFRPFPFCHVSEERLTWPMQRGSSPILPLGNPLATNGAMCRPCNKHVSGDRAWKALAELEEGPTLMAVGGPDLAGVCDASKPWAEGWQTIFDDVAGEEAATIRRKYPEHHRFEPPDAWVCACNVALRSLRKRAALWAGPKVEALCALTHLGVPQPASEAGNWTFFPEVLGKESVVYVFGVGPDISWDKLMIERYGMKVHVFSNTPASMEAVVQHQRTELPPQWIHHAFLISTSDSPITLKLPSEDHANETSATSTTSPVAAFTPHLSHVALPARTLQSLMKMNRHAKVDVLKMDIGGAEFDLISQWAAAKHPPTVCQLLIEFHRTSADAEDRRATAFADLQRLGFVFGASTSDHCLFVHPKFCLPSQISCNSTLTH